MNNATQTNWNTAKPANAWPTPAAKPDEEVIDIRARLKTPTDVAREMGKLYRMARRRMITVEEASRLGNLLGLIARILQNNEQEELARRLDKLEGKE